MEETSNQFYFACEPARVEELTQKLFQELERIKQGELDPVAVEKVREIAVRQRENNLKENRFWLNELKNIYFYGDDPEILLSADDYIKSLTKEIVVEKAQKYLDTEGFIQVVLFPQQ